MSTTNASPRPTLLGILVAISLFISACGSSSPAAVAQADSEAATDELVSTADATADVDSSPAAIARSVADQPLSPEPNAAALAAGQLAEVGERTNWQVRIDDRIDASMWLAQSDGFVRGEITYDAGDAPIDLIGFRYRSGQGYFLQEFGPDGRVSGTLTLEAVQDKTIETANWHGDNTGALPATVSFDSVAGEPYFFDPLLRPGVYEFSFGPFSDSEACCGAEGYLTIGDLAEHSAEISFSNHRGAPSYNLATVDPLTVPRDQNVLSVDAVDEIRDCAYDLTVFDGFAFVTVVNDRYRCGFGFGAHVEGIYVLTEPAATENASAEETSLFSNAELTATSFGPIEIGDSWADLVELGANPYNPDFDDFGTCHYTTIPDDPLSPWVMLVGEGPVATVARIELASPESTTDSGLRIGDTEADVLAQHSVTEEPHVYFLGEQAKYLFVEPADGATSTLFFETDASGEIQAARAGLLGPVRWIEGCL